MRHRYLFFFMLMCVTSLTAQQNENIDTLGLKQTASSKTFIDPYDSAFDISSYLFDLHGFLPILSPITEPAVGIGAALAGVFFIPKKKGSPNRFRTPDITGLAAGYTRNNTWFVGGGYLGFWKNDHIRYRGVFGYADVHLKYYGNGNDYLEEHPIQFNIKPYIFLQQALFRIKDSPFFIGGRYMLNFIKVNLDNEDTDDWLDPRDFDLISSGIGLIAEYENFNILLSPTQGWRIHLQYDQNLKWIGSDRNFGLFKMYALWYHPVSNYWNSGIRLAANITTGDAPFYFLPFIDMRGIPVMRYQGKQTLLMETEQEFIFKAKPRWSIVAFAGYGRTFNKNLNEELTGANAWNAGSGFRYLIARLMGLKMGLDAGFSKDSWSIYIVVGSAWLR